MLNHHLFYSDKWLATVNKLQSVEHIINITTEKYYTMLNNIWGQNDYAKHELAKPSIIQKLFLITHLLLKMFMCHQAHIRDVKSLNISYLETRKKDAFECLENIHHSFESEEQAKLWCEEVVVVTRRSITWLVGV